MFPVVEIPATDHVARHCFVGQTQKRGGRRFPSPDCFALRKGEEGLSVNWHERIDTSVHFILIGLQHNKLGEFLNPKSFRIFTLPVKFLRDLSGIDKVEHVPVFNGDPAPIGKPNNPWHAEVYYADRDNNTDVRLQLSEYCQHAGSESHKEFPNGQLEQHIAALQSRGNNTPYHRIKGWGETETD
jgi:hypothetical protein